MRFRYLLLLISFAFSLASVRAQAPAVENPANAKAKVGENQAKEKPSEKKEPQYIRVQRSKQKQPLALQTAIVRYRGKPNTPYAGCIVDLVGVVHIGQSEYYEELNKRLAKYDSVLYELVAPDGTRIKPEDLEKSRSLLSSMQSGMKDMLNLEYQLELVDYMADNFKHADMSPEEFVEDFERRGDSVVKMVARMMGAGMASSASTGGEAGMLMALLSNNRSMKMKQAMAQQLVDIETVTAGMSDANGEDTLIKGRNGKAFEVLTEVLKDGKKKIAVFYGAGHLPDMAKRLEQDFSMEEKKTSWLDGWDLTRN
ncbi:MAG: hypothetical protein P8L85_04160 [Rubripirellula sp.]|nr:hypothetical protein [Rubripirellula sp.]